MEIWKQINQKLIILLEWPINNDVDIIISGVGVFRDGYRGKEKMVCVITATCNHACVVSGFESQLINSYWPLSNFL